MCFRKTLQLFPQLPRSRLNILISLLTRVRDSAAAPPPRGTCPQRLPPPNLGPRYRAGHCTPYTPYPHPHPMQGVVTPNCPQGAWQTQPSPLPAHCPGLSLARLGSKRRGGSLRGAGDSQRHPPLLQPAADNRLQLKHTLPQAAEPR